MALRPEVAGFKRPVRSELPLNVQHVLHRVGSGVVVSVRVGVRRRQLGDSPISAGDRITPNQARIPDIRGERHSSPEIASQVEVDGIGNVLGVEEAPAGADHGLVIQRVGNADTRREVLVLGLHKAGIQTTAADRFRVGPTNVEAGIRVRAVALPDEVGPIGLRGVGRKHKLRHLRDKKVAQRIGEGRRQLVPQAE